MENIAPRQDVSSHAGLVHGARGRVSVSDVKRPRGAQELLTLVPVTCLVVVELDVRIRVQRDEEIEREIAVGATGECKDRAPIVEFTLECHRLTAELVRGEIVIRPPLRRPLGRKVEAHLRVDVLPRRLSDEWSTRGENTNWRCANWILTLLEDALIVQ